MKKTEKITKSQAGRMGGLTTFHRYGTGHMSEIGQRGARSLWAKYRLLPVGQSGWALIDRQSGRVKTSWGVR